MVGLLGVVVLLGLAFLMSEDRRAIRPRTVLGGLALQVAMTLLLLDVPPMRHAMLGLNEAVEALQVATDAGSSFVFGYLGGGPLPFAENAPGASFILAF